LEDGRRQERVRLLEVMLLTLRFVGADGTVPRVVSSPVRYSLFPIALTAATLTKYRVPGAAPETVKDKDVAVFDFGLLQVEPLLVDTSTVKSDMFRPPVCTGAAQESLKLLDRRSETTKAVGASGATGAGVVNATTPQLRFM
jgi:hypothetical protein